MRRMHAQPITHTHTHTHTHSHIICLLLRIQTSTTKKVPTEVAQDAGALPVPDGEKEQIRALLTGLMLSTPQLVRAQLSEALAIISGHDFPAK